MKKVQAILFAALVTCAVACSKEKVLDNRLNGNTWNIDSIEWVKTESDFSGFSYAAGTENNAGTFKFDETTGSSTMTIDGETEENVSFSWNVSSDASQLEMTYDLTIDATGSNQRVMVIEENKRKRQVWILTEQQFDLETQEAYQLVAEITLTKQ
ncbi:MAG: hypothetical protein MK081_15400 [Flavobacteriales bacterium]|nr:hypothetical protein [Flavobacteriales bacterium]